VRIALHWPLAGLAALALSNASCKGVLGLDAPELDTCPEGCDDGGFIAPDAADATGAVDAAPPDAHDAAIDQGPVKGLPCGTKDTGLIGCEGTTPVCCQITTDARTTYACRKSASACEDYPITCTRNDNCAGSDVCCQTKSGIQCTGVSSCGDTALICDPSGSDSQCPGGWSCSGTVTNAGQTLPYHACAK